MICKYPVWSRNSFVITSVMACFVSPSKGIASLFTCAPPFKDVIRQLEKSYNVQFRVHNTNVYKNCFTGTLENQHLDRILYVLAQTSDMKFKHLPADKASNNAQIIEIY